VIKVVIYTIAGLGGLCGVVVIAVIVLGERINKAISKAWGR
jgi:hypothetical protein